MHVRTWKSASPKTSWPLQRNSTTCTGPSLYSRSLVTLGQASCLVRGEKASLHVYNYYMLATGEGFSQTENFPTSCECLELWECDIDWFICSSLFVSFFYSSCQWCRDIRHSLNQSWTPRSRACCGISARRCCRTSCEARRAQASLPSIWNTPWTIGWAPRFPT